MRMQNLTKADFCFLMLLSIFWLPGRFCAAQSGGNDPSSGLTRKNALQKLEQSLGHELKIEWNADNGTPLFLASGLTTPGFAASYPSAQAAALSFLQIHSALFQIKSPPEELRLIKSSDDKLGMTHLRFEQKYKDLPVWGCELIIHFNKDGAISSINGRYLPSFDLSISPVISNATATIRARQCLQSIFGKELDSDQATPTLVIFPKGADKHLAWLVSVPNEFSPNSKCIINAITGETLWIDTGIRY